MISREHGYAVAVRDEELYFFLHVRRNPKGEVFAMIPMESPAGQLVCVCNHPCAHP